MASQDIVQQLEEHLETINQYKDVELISRPGRWGTITFKMAEQDIELAMSIAADLSSMPLSYLTDQAAQDIMRHIFNVSEYFKQIYEFKLEGTSKLHYEIAAHLERAVKGLSTATSDWIPYLAYKRGDFSESIQQIETAVKNAGALEDEAKRYAYASRAEVDEIVDAAREAAASAGVATFTSEFDAEAKILASGSKGWLWAIVVLAGATVGCAVLSFYWPSLPEDANGWITLRHVVAKVSVIAILFTGTVWCGRIYRALRHQRSINRHRALSLKTFQAFVKATDDPVTRDAVLTAATKSIFANVPTGFVEERVTGQDASVNVLDISRSASRGVPTGSGASPKE